MRAITRKQINRIHDASMDLLKTTGIKFNEAEALEIFKQHGVKVDGNVVFLREVDVLRALETAPHQFVIHARIGQPCVIAVLIIAGLTGPVTMADRPNRQKNAFEHGAM